MPHIERRSYVRGNFSFKIKFRTMTPAEYEELDMSNDTIFPQFQLTPGIDITGKKKDGDTAIDPTLINCLTLLNEKLDLILDLLDKDYNINGFQIVYMEIFGEVVHSIKVKEGGKTQYSLGIKFLDLSVDDQERIIASVFQRQRKVLRKRKTES